MYSAAQADWVSEKIIILNIYLICSECGREYQRTNLSKSKYPTKSSVMLIPSAMSFVLGCMRCDRQKKLNHIRFRF